MTTESSGCPMHGGESIVRDEKAQLDFSRDMSYGDYLHLDQILTAQHPLSPAHDEMRRLWNGPSGCGRSRQ